MIMTIKELTRDQVRFLYEKSMMIDFPDNERKPLYMIEEALDKGAYQCLGVVDEDQDSEILGYAFFMKLGNDYLFDYYVVLEGNRNAGIGSQFLSGIKEYFATADSVIGEVEDFTVAETKEEEELQSRRYHFYLRNGYVDTDVRVKLFGVDYRVIELDLEKKHTQEEIKKLYQRHYKAIFTKEIYEKMVIVKE